MKTSVELDDKKVELAKSLSRSRTLRELLDEALSCLIAQGRRESLADMLGTGFYDADLDVMRERKKNAR